MVVAVVGGKLLKQSAGPVLIAVWQSVIASAIGRFGSILERHEVGPVVDVAEEHRVSF